MIQDDGQSKLESEKSRFERLGKQLGDQFEDPDDSALAHFDSDVDREKFQGALNILKQIGGQIRSRKSNETIISDSTFPGGLTDEVTSRSVPDTIGRFKIETLVGRGGFATVYLAHDPVLDRPVALKVPKSVALMSEEALSRFRREAKTVALLSHPNIVPVFETGSIDGTTFIASGYCAGNTLREWFKEKKNTISSRLAAKIVLQISQAANYAHQRGVLHRDLKPDNILFKSEQAEVHPDHIAADLQITDFGLAKSIQSDDQTLTTDGAIIGTPAYMSPEQAKGEQNLDARSDIYSIGVILYELLTGKTPHRGENHISTLRAVENDIPVSPSKLRNTITKDLEAICLKAMAKRPEDRYETAHLFAQDLEDWLVGKPVVARNIGPWGKTIRWTARNPILAIALTCLLASLGIGLASTSWQWQKSVANLELAKKERQRTERHLESVETGLDALLESIGFHLGSNPTLKPFQNQVLRDILKIQLKLIVEEKDNPLVKRKTALAHFRVASIYRMLHDFDLSQQHLSDALVVLNANARTESLASTNWSNESGPRDESADFLILRVMLEEGTLKFAAKDFAKAIPLLVSTLELADKFETTKRESGISLIKVQVRRALGACYESVHEFDKAETAYKRALELEDFEYLGAHSQDWNYELASVYNSYGILQKRTGKTKEGLGTQIKGAKILGALCLGSPNNPKFIAQWAISEYNIGNAYFSQKDYKTAEGTYRKAVSGFENATKINQDDHGLIESYINATGMRATCLARLGKFEDAAKAFKNSIAIAESNPNLDSAKPALIRTLNNLARMEAEDLKMPEQGEKTFLRSIEICKQLLKERPNDIYTTKSISYAFGQLGLIAAGRRDWQLAHDYSEISLSYIRKAFETNTQAKDFTAQMRHALLDQAVYKTRLGDLSNAYKLADELALIKKSSLNAYHSARAVAKLHQEIQVMMEVAESEEVECEYDSDDLDEAANRAINQLKQAIESGFKDFGAIEENDKAWDAIRQLPSFKEIVELIESKKE